MRRRWISGFLMLAGLLPVLMSHGSQPHAQPKTQHPSLDAKVEQFLESNRHRWNAWNIPFEDGKILYFKDLDAKVAVGGCFTAHNTLRVFAQEVKDFLAYVKSKPNYRTRIEQGSGEGLSISCKTAP